GTAGIGTITSNALEVSTVDLTKQFVKLITYQRGFQANSRVIVTSDEVIQEIVNLKR
ncbi:MAG: flagellar hook protein, partial [Nitrospirae bacterium]|nr:flagellar hook protein [Candidatus Troglogloeales bacterium]